MHTPHGYGATSWLDLIAPLSNSELVRHIPMHALQHRLGARAQRNHAPTCVTVDCCAAPSVPQSIAIEAVLPINAANSVARNDVAVVRCACTHMYPPAPMPPHASMCSALHQSSNGHPHPKTERLTSGWPSNCGQLEYAPPTSPPSENVTADVTKSSVSGLQARGWRTSTE